MKIFNLDFKNRGIGFYLSSAAGIISVILGLIILISWKEMTGPNYFETHNFVAPGVALLIAGIITIILMFIPIKFSPMVGVIGGSIAFGLNILESVEFLAEMVNQTGYVQGVNFALDFVFIIGSAVVGILAVVACFFQQTKDDSEII